jgi:hypothetical protein
VVKFFLLGSVVTVAFGGGRAGGRAGGKGAGL